MNAVTSALATLGTGKGLSASASRSAFAGLLDGEASDIVVAAFLSALRVKGETVDELDGAVAAVHERMTPWESGMDAEPLLDTCGTGGDGVGTINISTAAAIVVAACGVPVVKHGNRAATGVSGSSDVLSVLGVATNLEPAASRRCLAELGIAFLFAPMFHPGIVRVAPVRRQLPFRTIFNLAGPLCNPSRPSHQLVGVPNDNQAELVAQVLSRQEHILRAVVVTGCDGLDEVTLDGPTHVWTVEGRTVRREVWLPEHFGLNLQGTAMLKVRDPLDSADKLTRAFNGEKGPVRDFILANSAAALWVARQIPLHEGTAVAASAIDSGAVAGLLERWRQLAPVATALSPDSRPAT
jgi:anthranilate phosphoribosyltransferase